MYPMSIGMTIGSKYTGRCALAGVKIQNGVEVNRICGNLLPGL